MMFNGPSIDFGAYLVPLMFATAFKTKFPKEWAVILWKTTSDTSDS